MSIAVPVIPTGPITRDEIEAFVDGLSGPDFDALWAATPEADDYVAEAIDAMNSTEDFGETNPLREAMYLYLKVKIGAEEE